MVAVVAAMMTSVVTKMTVMPVMLMVESSTAKVKAWPASVIVVWPQPVARVALEHRNAPKRIHRLVGGARACFHLRESQS
jgi:hypothetical protein